MIALRSQMALNLKSTSPERLTSNLRRLVDASESAANMSKAAGELKLSCCLRAWGRGDQRARAASMCNAWRNPPRFWNAQRKQMQRAELVYGGMLLAWCTQSIWCQRRVLMSAS